MLALNQVEECVDVERSEVLGDGKRRIINLRGKTIPLIDLRDVFEMDRSDDSGAQRLVIVDAEGMTVGFRVDGVVGKQQVVIKPFTMNLRQVPTIAGATILGDGSVAFILNIREIFKSQRQSEPLAREGATT
ncbi:MAG TPA: chemotaxis protein CheW [Spirochaetia bacterium]|nr:chemotaxis protein CheW [Spirochaetia bacterium]